MQVQLDQLTTFLAVVDTGTFDGAARTLQITPSAVSQRIKALEVGVGRVLLQRTKPVQPTESGQILARLARQTTLLASEAAAELGGSMASSETPTSEIPIVINADSLATWALPPLARLAEDGGIRFDVHREDEQHSVDLLRAGTVMAAVTAIAEPVQGCSVRRLGRMRYLLVTSPGYAERWLPGGLTVDNLALAPMLAFDHKDDLQNRYLRRRSRRPLDPPRHYVPSSAEFARAVTLSMGWGLLPEHDAGPLLDRGTVIMPEPHAHVDVSLYWQRWRLPSRVLDRVSETIIEAAAVSLR